MAEQAPAWGRGAGLAPPGAAAGTADAGPLHGAARTALGLALALSLLLVLRVLTMRASGAGLHVDEAQYWDWSRTLQWGYWSKPPGVAALIAVSTTLFGDGVTGVRLLGMACWPAAAAALAALAWRIAGPGLGRRAAWWTAAVFAATPAAGLLGLVVTTDGPLMLCWSLAMAGAWTALSAEAAGRPAWYAWAATGLVIGLGLLAKYTIAALALSALPLLWTRFRACAAARGAQPPWRTLAGLALAATLALLLLLPNLLWNARHGWPTLTHTAAITAQATAAPGQGPLASLAEFLAGQLLMVGPAALVLAAWMWRRAARRPAAAGPGERFALALALPLLGLGLLQALNAKAQMNWTAPALAGLSLWLGLRAARAGLGRSAWLASTAAGLAITTALALLASVAPGLAGRSADVWARMRGWDDVFGALRPALGRHPALPVVATERDVLVQARYAWRTQPLPARAVQAWPADGAPQNHYQQFQPLVPSASHPAADWPQAVLLLCEHEPLPAQRARYARWQRLADAQAASGRRLSLWRGDGPQQPAATGPLAPVSSSRSAPLIASAP